MKLCTLFTAAMFVAATVGSASADLLVTEGDFEAGGASWGQAAAGVTFSFPATGGNGGGYAQADQGPSGWGGVLINDGDTAVPLAGLGLAGGDTAEITIDLINLGGGTPVAGIKVESWDVGLISDSGDVTFAPTDAWATYTFDYTFEAAATHYKFVPLLVSQPDGTSVGYDNVGIVTAAVPEPTSLGLLALGMTGLIARRRRG